MCRSALFCGTLKHSGSRASEHLYAFIHRHPAGSTTICTPSYPVEHALIGNAELVRPDTRMTAADEPSCAHSTPPARTSKRATLRHIA